MDESAWTTEFMGKELPAGKFAPLVKLRRAQGVGPRETTFTFSGAYETHDEAARAAQDLYARIGGQPPSG